METCNSWPNRETWLAACWWFTYRYGRLMNDSLEMWRATRGRDRSQRVRRRVAVLMRHLVTTANESIDGLDKWRLDAVQCERIADQSLGIILDYRRAWTFG